MALWKSKDNEENEWTGTLKADRMTSSELIGAAVRAENLTNGGLVLTSGGILSDAPGELFWDITNKRLGIGTAGPSDKLNIYSTGSTDVGIIAGTNSRASIKLINDAQEWDFRCRGDDAFSINDVTNANDPMVIFPSAYNNQAITIQADGDTVFNLEHGNVGVGDSNPLYKMSVSGAILMKNIDNEPTTPTTGCIIFSSGGLLYSKSTAGNVTKITTS